MSCAGKDLSRAELEVKKQFIRRCWSYLNDNFHKFTQANQIKIALAIAMKDIPQEHTGEIRYTAMSTITIENKTLDLDIGEDIPESIRSRMT